MLIMYIKNSNKVFDLATFTSRLNPASADLIIYFIYFTYTKKANTLICLKFCHLPIRPYVVTFAWTITLTESFIQANVS